jgi:hypothetical protein
MDIDLSCIQQHVHIIHNEAQSLLMDKFEIKTEG